jgi:hypothetical protein
MRELQKKKKKKKTFFLEKSVGKKRAWPALFALIAIALHLLAHIAYYILVVKAQPVPAAAAKLKILTECAEATDPLEHGRRPF